MSNKFKNNNNQNFKAIFEEGLIFFSNQDYLKAEKNFENILIADPNRISVLNNLAATKIKLQKFKEAENLCKKILDIESNNFDAQINLSICMGEQFKFEESIEIIDKLLCSNKIIFAEAYIQKARMLNKLGKFIEAKKIYERVLDKEPNNYLARWNLSLQNLLLKNFEEAWPDYHCRFDKDKKLKKQYSYLPQLLSPGEYLQGKKIVIWCEQGYGDVIQFARYITLLKKYKCILFLEIAKPLVSLFKYYNDTLKINEFDFYDYQISIMDLPKIFGTTFNTIPDITPYFSIPKTLVEENSKFLENNKKINVGLAWSGRSDFGFDSLRSLKLIALKPIYDLTNSFNFYCLQKDIRKVDQHAFEKSGIHHVGKNMNFLETGAFIENLDLVISSDTSILHLSGSLRKKTFAILPLCPDWRWFLESENSPWYRSLRLFRSKNITDDWNDIILEIKKELINTFH